MKAKAIAMGIVGGGTSASRWATPETRSSASFDTGRTIGIYPGSSWTIVDSEDVLGVNLNIKPKR